MFPSADAVYDEMVQSLQLAELFFRDEIHVSQIRYLPETVSEYGQIEVFSPHRYHPDALQMFGPVARDFLVALPVHP